MNVLAAAGILVGLVAGYVLLLRVLRTVVVFVNDVAEVAVALFFYIVLVPPLWLWERGRRPIWRTLTKQQSDDLAAWLHRGR